MKDIEQMKRKFEEELRLAQKANDFESRYGVEPIVFTMYGVDMISINCNNELAKRLLNEMEADQLWAVDHEKGSENMFYYRVYSRRGYSDRYSILEVEFFNRSTKYCLKIQIDGNDLLAPFFKNGRRQITDSELSTWHPTDHRGLLNRDLTIPTKGFNAKSIRYHGGSELLVDEEEINRIINALKHGNYENHD